MSRGACQTHVKGACQTPRGAQSCHLSPYLCVYSGTQFTCFSSTKVRILTSEEPHASKASKLSTSIYIYVYIYIRTYVHTYVIHTQVWGQITTLSSCSRRIFCAQKYLGAYSHVKRREEELRLVICPDTQRGVLSLLALLLHKYKY